MSASNEPLLRLSERGMPVELQVVSEAAFGDFETAKALLLKLNRRELQTFSDLLARVSDLIDDEHDGRVLAQRLDG